MGHTAYCVHVNQGNKKIEKHNLCSNSRMNINLSYMKHLARMHRDIDIKLLIKTVGLAASLFSGNECTYSSKYQRNRMQILWMYG